jgi:antitoxin (DNA-binding transcriptional repressor) of toxin-antitoxin stability system
MATYVSKSQFRAKASELFRRIELDGEPVIITHRGSPVLEVRRYFQRARDPLEALRGSVLYYNDPFEPVGVEDWEALK